MKWRPGIRVIEKGDGYRIVRFSWWVSDSVIDDVLENICRDAKVFGKTLTVTRGHRDVRVDGL